MSSVRRSFDLPVAVAEWLKARAAETGESQVQIVELALRRELCPGDYYTHGCEFRSSIRFAKPFACADGLVDPAEVPDSSADRLSGGLFRSTGLSEHEADDHGQGEGVGE